jgi:hypothetical protein
MWEILFWVYLVNSVLLINHEIDSAYWREWDLFKLPGGVTAFLMMHVPLMFFVLYGLVLVFQRFWAGLMFSLILSFAGLFAFAVHAFFLRQGRQEFNTPVSLLLLIAILAVSVIQAVTTIYLLMV